MSGPSFGLAELRRFALAEAGAIETHQAVLVKAGLRAAPDAGEVAKADRLAALARLCDLIIADPDLSAALRAAAQRMRSRAASPMQTAEDERDGA